MQNGLRISNRGSFLQRIAPNHHEVILKYLAFQDWFSQKWQLCPVLITIHYTDFFQQIPSVLATGSWKSISHLRIQCYKRTCDPVPCSQPPQVLHQDPHNVTGAPPTSLSWEHQQVQVSAPLSCLTKLEFPACASPDLLSAPGAVGQQGASESVLQWSAAKTFFINALLFCSLYPMWPGFAFCLPQDKKKKSIDMCYSSCKIIVTTEVMQQSQDFRERQHLSFK